MSGAQQLPGVLAAPPADTSPGAAAAAGTGTPRAPLRPHRLCGETARRRAAAPPTLSTGMGDAGKRGPHPTRPRAAAVPRAAPGSAPQPPARPPGPCQAIFISAASVIAIKPTMCGRRRCARGVPRGLGGGRCTDAAPAGRPVTHRGARSRRGWGGGGCRGAQNLHRQSQSGRPQPSADIPAAGEGPPIGSAAVSSVSLGTGGGRWSRGSGVGSVRGERGVSVPGQGPVLHGRRSTALPLHLSSFSAVTTCALTQRRRRLWVPLLPQALREQGLQEDQ